MIDLTKACSAVRIRVKMKEEQWTWHTWTRSELYDLVLPEHEEEKARGFLESYADDYWLEYYMPCDDQWHSLAELRDIAGEAPCQKQ